MAKKRYILHQKRKEKNCEDVCGICPLNDPKQRTLVKSNCPRRIKEVKHERGNKQGRAVRRGKRPATKAGRADKEAKGRRVHAKGSGSRDK